MSRNCPRIESFNTQYALAFQVIRQACCGSEITGIRLILFYQKGRNLNAAGFNVFRIDPIVSDKRIGHYHHLPAVRRVGENFLISGHAGIKYNFTRCFPGAGE